MHALLSLIKGFYSQTGFGNDKSDLLNILINILIFSFVRLKVFQFVI